MFETLSRITGSDIVTVSPFTDIPKTLFATTMLIIFLELTLRVLRHVNKGITMSGPMPVPIPLTIEGGNLTAKKKNMMSIYKGPGITAILGLTFYFVAHFMIFVLFKSLDYSFNY